MNWQGNLSWQQAKKIAIIMTEIRSFFANLGVVEVSTPILAQASVTDVHLDSFSTTYAYNDQTPVEQVTTLYTQTSPEFAMKRLLALGFGCCYQICKAFRHEQQGRFHNPEFTLLEWYRLGFTYTELMQEVDDFLQHILSCTPCEKISYQDLFLKYVNVDPLTTTENELLTVISEKKCLSDWLLEENKDTLLQFIMAEIIEPNIGMQTPCFVYDFPASQASLAKISRNDPRVAERFECYFKGIELANGFSELTDAQQQLSRFEQDNSNRIAQGKPSISIDQRFIAALESGLPECAGVALGIDRLLMLALNCDSIEQVINFTTAQA